MEPRLGGTTARSERLPAAYWRLWTASTVSNLGDGVFLVALPLLAARLTRSEVSISLVAAAAALPWLLLSLPIGALIDRSDRKRVLIISDMCRAVIVAGLAVVAATGAAEIWMLWAVALMLGIAEVFFDNASQALVPSVVPAHLLEKANGRRYAAEIAANTFVGTPLGSLLFATAIWIPFGVQAATFALAVMLIVPIRGRFNPTGGPVRTGTTSLYAEVRTGMRWLWGNALLRTLAISLGLSNLGFQVAQGVFVLFAQEELGISERMFGVLLAIMGLGAVVGGLLGDRVVSRVGPSVALLGALTTWVITMVMTFLFPIMWVVATMAAIESMAATLWNVVSVSLRQQIVPAHLFGRVNSVYRWFGWGTIPIGAVLGGQVAAAYGLRATYLVGAGFVVAALVVARRHVRPDVIEQEMNAVRPRGTTDDTPMSIERDDLLS